MAGVIDEVREKLDIVDVVSEYVRLQKAGSRFKALCPFHSEKTASFLVDPSRQSWHCFGACGTGGDIFSFVMKADNVEFGEALRILAQKAGIALTSRSYDQAEDKQRAKLYEINAAAANYFHNLLLNNHAARVAREHLAQRGVNSNTVEEFQLGYSLESWDALRKHLGTLGYSDEELVAAGLLVQKDENYHDRFRNRLMFPIRDDQGRNLGFGGRALDDTKPKYLNSPQTPVFDKSSILYGIDLAKASIKQQNLAIVVEGYVDVVMAHQYGRRTVVATMGTNLTEKQVDALKRLTKNIVLAFDADVAGEQATIKQILEHHNRLESGLRIMSLPPGRDPDEIIKESVEQWQRLVDGAEPFLDYLFGSVISKLDLKDPRDKSTAVEQLMPIIADIKNPVERAHYIQKLARLVQVDERVLQSSLAGRRDKPTRVRRIAAGDSKTSSQQIKRNFGEEYCLALMFQHPETRDIKGISSEHFTHIENRQLFDSWQLVPHVATLRASLDPALVEHLDHILGIALPPITEKDLHTALEDCFRSLEKRRIQSHKAQEAVRFSEIGTEETASEHVLQLQQAAELNARLGEIFAKGSSKTRRQ